MKKYSCHQAQKGKTAYRTPDRFISKAVKDFWKNKIRKSKKVKFS